VITHLKYCRSAHGSSTHATSNQFSWPLGCWNQHRVGSYVQRNCPWVMRLREQGASAREVSKALANLRVGYASAEVRGWMQSCNVVGLQEVDEPLREVIRSEPPVGELIETARHLDGRGVEVDCTNATLIAGSVEVRQRAFARLQVKLPRIVGWAAREHVAVLLEVENDWQDPLVFCSVHLHPPDMLGPGYIAYLEPLKQALNTLLSESSAPAACALVGDFNTSPSEFFALTSDEPFWAQFSSVECKDGATAHASNPCPKGDFGLFREAKRGPESASAWRCSAVGPPHFADFERYGDQLFNNLQEELAQIRVEADVQSAVASLRRASLTLTSNPRRPPPPPLPKGSLKPSQCSSPSEVMPPAPAPPPISEPPWGSWPPASLSSVNQAISALEPLHSSLKRHRQKAGIGGRGLVKGLRTSDHRPLVFENLHEGYAEVMPN